jgi:hypothetical protein
MNSKVSKLHLEKKDGQVCQHQERCKKLQRDDKLSAL